MSRTEGSGWGGGVILYQKCPLCKKKKAYYDWKDYTHKNFRCTSCKERFSDDNLIDLKYAHQMGSIRAGEKNGR